VARGTVELPQEIQLQKDEWQEELEKDKIPPEDFKPEIVKINNKYYLAFSTKDKNSGIDHYDVLEKPQAKSLLKSIIAKWVKTNSPYLLKNQSLSSNIEVRAVDKAGNERIVKLQDTYSLPWYKNYLIWHYQQMRKLQVCIFLLLQDLIVLEKLLLFLFMFLVLIKQ
jgi:hypothetical protein